VGIGETGVLVLGVQEAVRMSRNRARVMLDSLLFYSLQEEVPSGYKTSKESTHGLSVEVVWE
jgi:hypothetical protein